MSDHQDDHILPDTEEEEDEFFEDEIDYTGAVCSRCSPALDEDGYCTNTTSSCPYSDYHQDEPGGWLEKTEQEEQL